MQFERIVETEHGIVDKTTGEILGSSFSKTRQTIVKKATHENFVQLYVSDISNLCGIKSRLQFSLLLALCNQASVNKEDSNEYGLVTFYALHENKVEWARIMETDYGKSIDNALAGLVKNGIVLKISRAKYALNPKYIFIGALKDRERAVELCIKYNFSDGE